jgi:hypothetical protein
MGNGKWEILGVQGMYETRGDKLPGVMAMRFEFFRGGLSADSAG